MLLWWGVCVELTVRWVTLSGDILRARANQQILRFAQDDKS